MESKEIYDFDVSIVIVCMNNLKNLYPCLESIKKYTNQVTYETLVVAYLFSEDNLKKVKIDFPWVTFIESNEIRGFSENNNLALKQARGRYCFVLNDDTEMRMPVIDSLVETIEMLPDEVAVVSPKSYYGDGRIQSCGRPKHSFWTFILSSLKLWKEQEVDSPYVNQKGIFQTYDLWGAFFLIKTDIFKSIGWFDERYFFCPEDIALSDRLNREGYKCYVNADVSIIHYEGMTGKSVSLMKTATKPAAYLGNIIFYAERNKIKQVFFPFIVFLLLVPSTLFHYIKGWRKKTENWDYVLAKSNINCIKVLFSEETPKSAFIKFYSQINK